MANNTTTTKKVTKSQRNTDIITMLNDEAVRAALANVKVQYGTTADDAIAHLNHENDLLASKNKPNGKKKLTKDQQANEQYKDDIRDFMRKNPARLVSANEVMVEVFMVKYPDKLWSNQKAASLLNAMADKLDKDGNVTDDSGELEKFPAKGKAKTTYRMKPEYLDIPMEGDDITEEEETAEE